MCKKNVKGSMGLFGASEAPQESLPFIITDHCHTAYVAYSLTKLLEGNLTHFFFQTDMPDK